MRINRLPSFTLITLIIKVFISGQQTPLEKGTIAQVAVAQRVFS
jgi:hypothetical protein